jgi:hypothetical protein
VIRLLLRYVGKEDLVLKLTSNVDAGCETMYSSAGWQAAEVEGQVQ